MHLATSLSKAVYLVSYILKERRNLKCNAAFHSTGELAIMRWLSRFYNLRKERQFRHYDVIVER